MAAKDKNLGHCPVRRDFAGFLKVAKTNMIFLKFSKDSLPDPLDDILQRALYFTFKIRCQSYTGSRWLRLDLAGVEVVMQLPLCNMAAKRFETLL